MKTRFAKPFESVQVKIPYETGMDPYSGLVELFEKEGILTASGNRLRYVDLKGVEHLEYRKGWTGEKLDMVMKEYHKIKPKSETDTTAETETVKEKR